MKKIWLDGAWEDYTKWQEKDKKAFKKINNIIKSVDRNGYDCIGRPERLSGNLSNWWSVKFNAKDRIVFRIVDNAIEFLQIGTHYGDK